MKGLDFAIGGRPGSPLLAGRTYDTNDGWFICSNLGRLGGWIFSWHDKPHYTKWAIHIGSIDRWWRCWLLVMGPRFTLHVDRW